MKLKDEHPDLFYACECNSIDSSDIERVISFINGQNDYADWHWICLIRPKEIGTGRDYNTEYTFAYITGGCDYTGWDCRSSAERFDGNSIDEVLKQVPQDFRRELEEKVYWK